MHFNIETHLFDSYTRDLCPTRLADLFEYRTISFRTFLNSDDSGTNLEKEVELSTVDTNGTIQTVEDEEESYPMYG